MSGFRCDLSFDPSLVTSGLVGIGHWQECLLVQDDVTKVEPLLNAIGGSRKSEVDESVIRRGGGHLCPWELHAYIDGTSNACRMTTGMTVHGDGKLHVYCRQLPRAMDATAAHEVFFSAARLLEEVAAARCAPAPPPKPRPQAERSPDEQPGSASSSTAPATTTRSRAPTKAAPPNVQAATGEMPKAPPKCPPKPPTVALVVVEVPVT